MRRRLLWAALQRLLRWEFWPVWAIYPPVLISVIWNGIRLRGVTLWVNCNPAMGAGGIALEPKGKILGAFKGADKRVRIGGFESISPDQGDAMARLSEVMAKRGFEFPVVLKPEVGQRGQGVLVARDQDAAERWVAECHEPFLVQEYIGGLEFGVHWAQFPGCEEGRITSLCRKHVLGVTGNARNTLRELIVADDRAVLMARYYFRKFSADLERVPADGEEFLVAPIGTHSRGSVFTDERQLITEELREAFDELGARYPGFQFGRYDVKVPSIEDLQAGRNIVVLELNGVMGEPAHVYQPGYPWRRGIADLCSHFRLAAEIGAAWREQGESPPELGDIVDLIRQHREKTYLEVDDFGKTK